MSNLAKALSFTLRWEGGASAHSSDTAARQRLAGETIHTNKGITQGTYNGFRQTRGVLYRPVRLITDAEVQAIYEQQYWLPAGCHKLEMPACAALFDLAVNSGVGRARGVMIEATKKGFTASDPQGLAEFICDWRGNFFNAIIRSNPTQTVFKKGWFNRLRALKEFIAYRR